MGQRSKGGPPSLRQLRVGEAVRHALSTAFERGDIHDRDLAEWTITITEVRMSPDLKNATAFFQPLGGANPDQMQVIRAALKRAAPYLQSVVGRASAMKSTPRISFQPDQSFDEADRVTALLRSDGVRRDLNADDEDDGPAA